jgi:ribosomal protein S18 acetylase RimI-like enzyme
MEIHIRPARFDDAQLLAKIFVYAIGQATAVSYLGETCEAVLTDICQSVGTQYSYRNALVAECEGQRVGAIIGYDGAELHTLRAGTFSVIRRYKRVSEMPEDETAAGEFYIDSIGVLPDFRGAGVGRRLLQAMCSQAADCGHQRVGLLVDLENPDAERLYRSLGFECENMQTFFGHQMKHLVWRPGKRV